MLYQPKFLTPMGVFSPVSAFRWIVIGVLRIICLIAAACQVKVLKNLFIKTQSGVWLCSSQLVSIFLTVYCYVHSMSASFCFALVYESFPIWVHLYLPSIMFVQLVWPSCSVAKQRKKESKPSHSVLFCSPRGGDTRRGVDSYTIQLKHFKTRYTETLKCLLSCHEFERGNSEYVKNAWFPSVKHNIKPNLLGKYFTPQHLAVVISWLNM